MPASRNVQMMDVLMLDVLMVPHRRSLLPVMLKAFMHERWREALGDTRRDAALLKLLKLKADRSLRRSRWVHRGQQISVHIRHGSVRAFEVGGQPVADRPRGTNNPRRENASAGSPILGVENAVHEEVRVAGQDIDFLVTFILQLEQVLVNLAAALDP